MIPSEIPSRPWQTLSADLFYVQQSWFLIVVDDYSKFSFVKKLHNLTTGAVVDEMKMLFAENGIAESLQCANGTQFNSLEFQQLASQYGFEIVMSSPHYPCGHGLAPDLAYNLPQMHNAIFVCLCYFFGILVMLICYIFVVLALTSIACYIFK